MSVGAIIEAQVRAVGTKAASAELAGFGRTATAVGKQVDKGLGASLARGLTKTGQAAESVGRTLTKSVSLPLAVAGAAAIKLAFDFDTAFARIGALAGKLGVSVDEAKKHVLALAGETAQSPQDLANALYFVASAGLKASQVMPVLDAAAKAAAAGMGDAATIAQTLTAVVNAYAGTGLTAAKATNIMTEAVKVGKAEATDFATGLGPVIGIAAQAGVSFSDLAAAIAQATNLGLPFDRAVTAARFVIQSLESPTAKAKNALHDYGFEVAAIHNQLSRPGGLQHVLQTLADTFDLSTAKGREAWAAVTGGARGAVLAVDLVGKHTDATNGILTKLDASAKAGAHTFDTAYAKATNTAAFRTEQLMRKLQATGIVLGEKLLPLVDKGVAFVTKLADKFNSLTDAQQANILKWAGIAIAAGPVLRIFGGILRIGGPLVGMLSKLGAASASAGTAASGAGSAAAAGGASLLGNLAGVGALAYGAVKGYKELTQVLNKDYRGALDTVAGAYGRLTGNQQLLNVMGQDSKKVTEAQTEAVGKLFAALNTGKTTVPKLSAELDRLKYSMSPATWKQLKADVALAEQQFAKLHPTVGVAQTTIAGLTNKLHLLGHGLTTNQSKWLNAYVSVGDYTDAIKYLQGIVDSASTKFDKQNAKIAASHKPIHTAIGDYDALTGAIKLVPHEVNTKVNLKGLRDAYAAAGDWKAYLRSFPPTIETTFKIAGTNLLLKQAGGVVPGTGSGDIVPAMLEPGEVVVPRSVVKRYGGPAALQSSLGMVHAMRQGGTVPAPSGWSIGELHIDAVAPDARAIVHELDWYAKTHA